MTADEKRIAQRVPVALRIKLRYQRIDQFISKFATNLSRGGMFLSSRNPKPAGTKLYFELRLADDSPVIEGTGEVRWARDYDRNRPDRPYGMGIRFLQLSAESRALLERVVAHRERHGATDLDRIPGEEHGVLSERQLAGEGEDGPFADSDDQAEDDGPAAAPVPELAPPGSPRPARATLSSVAESPAAIDAALVRARALSARLARPAELERELGELLAVEAVPIATIDQASRDLAARLGGSAVDSARYRASREALPAPASSLRAITPPPRTAPVRAATPTPVPSIDRIPTSEVDALDVLDEVEEPAIDRSPSIDAALIALEDDADGDDDLRSQLAHLREDEASDVAVDQVLAELEDLKQASTTPPPRLATEIPIDVDLDPAEMMDQATQFAPPPAGLDELGLADEAEAPPAPEAEPDGPGGDGKRKRLLGRLFRGKS